MKFIFKLLLLLFISSNIFAQSNTTTTGTVLNNSTAQNFYNFQMQFERVKSAYAKYYNAIKQDFIKNKMTFPPKEISIRAFKWNRIVEAWVKLENSDTFMLYKSFRMCASSGNLGPKRKEGDLQIPEGLYFIDEFNPKSDYFLSLLVNYPNFSDLKFSDPKTPGGDIYIHGSCATIGCLPINDDGIQELYLLCILAKNAGQMNIPINIYPARFNSDGLKYLGLAFKDNKKLLSFWTELKKNYDYFEKYHNNPMVMYDNQGNYLIGD